MKTYNIQTLLLITFFLYNSFTLLSQVGINTKNARKTLEVAGDMIVSQTLNVMNFNDLKDTGTSTFLLQEQDNSIKSIDLSNLSGAALGYIQEYIIVNPNLDWIRDFDTGINATDFVLIIISTVFDADLQLQNGGNRDEMSTIPYSATFINGGTWHIIADYPMAANSDPNEVGTWIITTLIFSNDLNKQFGTIQVPMEDGTTGSAILPVID